MWGKATEYAAEQKCEEQRTSQMEKKVQKIWQKQKRQAKSWRWLYVEKKKKNVQLNLICLQRQMDFYSVSKLISIQLSHLVLIFFSNWL